MLGTLDTEFLETLLVLIQLHFLILPILLSLYVTVPVALKVFQLNYRAATLILLVSFFMIYVLFGTQIVISGFFFLLSCGSGFLMGSLFRKKYDTGKIFIVGILFIALTCAWGITFYDCINEDSLGDLYSHTLIPWVRVLLDDQIFQTEISDSAEEMTPEKQKLFEDIRSRVLSKLTAIVHYHYPALVLIAGITMGFISFFRCIQLIPETGQHAIQRLSFEKWRCPDLLTAAFVLTGLAASSRLIWKEAIFFPHLGINLLLPVLWIYFLQGISLISFYALQWKIPKLLRWIFYFMFAFRPHFQLILSGIGIADTWIDFRKFASYIRSDGSGKSDEKE